MHLHLETQIRGEWKTYHEQDMATLPGDELHVAARMMAGIIVIGFPGSHLRAWWMDGEDRLEMQDRDPILDDYIVEAREQARVYADSLRLRLREAET